MPADGSDLKPGKELKDIGEFLEGSKSETNCVKSKLERLLDELRSLTQGQHPSKAA